MASSNGVMTRQAAVPYRLAESSRTDAMAHSSSPTATTNDGSALADRWSPAAMRRVQTRLRLRALLRWTARCLCLGVVSVATIHWLIKPDHSVGQWVDSSHAVVAAPSR